MLTQASTHALRTRRACARRPLETFLALLEALLALLETLLALLVLSRLHAADAQGGARRKAPRWTGTAVEFVRLL
jgi:hypothetical protein